MLELIKLIGRGIKAAVRWVWNAFAVRAPQTIGRAVGRLLVSGKRRKNSRPKAKSLAAFVALMLIPLAALWRAPVAVTAAPGSKVVLAADPDTAWELAVPDPQGRFPLSAFEWRAMGFRNGEDNVAETAEAGAEEIEDDDE